MHEDPEIPNYRKFRRGIKLRAGMTLAVEPMINLGTERVVWMDDDWTVVTQDMDLSAHYENTILIREGKPEILSLTDSEIEFARSKSGHDKNQIYLIKEKDEKFVYLVNGTTRTLDMPKKKNAKHIQIIKNLPIEVTEILEENLSDLTVKRAIKQYCQMNDGRQES